MVESDWIAVAEPFSIQFELYRDERLELWALAYSLQNSASDFHVILTFT